MPVRATTTTDAQVYVVPNGGSVTDTTRLFNVDVVTNETVLIEPSFPSFLIPMVISWPSWLWAASTVNVFITGDKEEIDKWAHLNQVE